MRVWFGSLVERTELKKLAADANMTMTDYVKKLVAMAVSHFKLTGKHLIDGGAEKPNSIAELLQSCDLQKLAAEIPYPIERLKELRTGDYPDDRDLAVLAASSLGTTIEELEKLRHQCNAGEEKCKK